MSSLALEQSDQDFINRIRLAHVASVNPDGTPHVSPKGTFWAINESSAGFVHIRSGRTVRNLTSRPEVTVSVTDIFQRRGLILTGLARVVAASPDADEFAELRESFIAARGPFPRAGRAIVLVVNLDVERVTSPAYDNGATVEQVESAWRRHYETGGAA